jgi:NADPH:quinone reductase-like Zn-dependent oxidoreductase
LDVVDLPDPVPGDGKVLYDVSSAGINYAGTRHPASAN